MKTAKRLYYKHCRVPNCKNSIRNAPDKKFFPFPQDPKKRQQWCKLMGKYETIYSRTTSLHCCEDHFNVEEDAENYFQYKIMQIQNGQKVTLRLKKDAVPHRFECQENVCLEKGVKRTHIFELEENSKILSKKNRAQADNHSNKIGESPYDPCVPGPNKEPSTADNICPKKIIDSEGDPSQDMSQMDVVDPGIKEEDKSECSMEPTYTNIADSEIKIEDEFYSGAAAVHVDSVLPKNLTDSDSDSALSDIVIADSEIELKYEIDYSAVQSHLNNVDLEDNINCELDTNVVSINVPCKITYNTQSGCMKDDFDIEKKYLCIRRMCLFACIEREPKMLLGLQKKSFHFIKQLSENLSLPIVNIIITFKKIKLNETYSILALQFGTKQTTISRIFSKSVVCIAAKMKEFIKWPTPSMIKSNLPISFRASYSNVVSIIDFFEIEFEKPFYADRDALCWSSFKKCHTFKFLVSYTPDGLITFISRGFSGGDTDLSIVEESGFLDDLPPDSAVMVDRGIKGLGSFLKQKKCSLITLPFLSTSTKSTYENVKQLRMHIGRLRSRLREFNMLLPACFDNNLIPFLDDIVVVACGLMNVQNDKYKMSSI